MKSDAVRFQSVDEYVASLPQATQTALQEVRATIKAAVPRAQEKVSYQMGAVELDSTNLIYFAGWKNHISIYPIPAGNAAFNEEVAPYIEGKGTLKFPLSKPLPLDLIRRIALQAAENLNK